jgi:predicted nucleotidyltransferase
MGDRTIRDRFLEEALRFIRTASTIPGVRRIALMGSIVTEKLNPKDIDLLVTISDVGACCAADAGNVAGSEPDGGRVPHRRG